MTDYCFEFGFDGTWEYSDVNFVFLVRCLDFLAEGTGQLAVILWMNLE